MLCSDKSKSGNNNVVKLKTTYTKIIHNIVNINKALILKYFSKNNNNIMKLTNIIVEFGDIVENVDSFDERVTCAFVDERVIIALVNLQQRLSSNCYFEVVESGESRKLP